MKTKELFDAAMSQQYGALAMYNDILVEQFLTTPTPAVIENNYQEDDTSKNKCENKS
jgi:hypothetical protein